MHLRILAFSLLIFGPIGFANARELFSFTFSEDTIDIKESKHDMSMLILPIVTFSPLPCKRDPLPDPRGPPTLGSNLYNAPQIATGRRCL